MDCGGDPAPRRHRVAAGNSEDARWLETRRLPRRPSSARWLWARRPPGESLMFALDTNVVIHAMKGIGRVAERLARTNPDEIAIPAVVLYELEFAALRSSDPPRRQRDLERLIAAMTALSFDDRAAARTTSLRYDLEKAGLSIGPTDALIAGTALAHGARLVTHNT